MTYSDAQTDLQDIQGRRALADRMAMIVADTMSDDQQQFITGLDHFFLATVDAQGHPSVSYKGGDVGVVRVLDDHTLVFPSYDGNGMYWSTGNVMATGAIGLLFIDMVTPQRLRVQADAELSRDEQLVGLYPGAEFVIVCTVRQVFPNCARYVHRHERVSASTYVPDGAGDQPHPSWKRIDLVQDVLSDDERDATVAAGGPISADDYAGKLAEGTS